MKEQILQLRAEGKTYKEIMSLLGCCKATIAYHCNKGTRDAIRKHDKIWKRSKTARIRMMHSVDKFKRDQKLQKRLEGNITLDEVYNKYGTHTNCYLSGRFLDLNEGKYHFDHIIPIAKGGTCNLDNLGITCPEANMAKSSMTIDELLLLCVDILKYNGYEIINKNE